VRNRQCAHRQQIGPDQSASRHEDHRWSRARFRWYTA
jgi:hypothetical protein